MLLKLAESIISCQCSASLRHEVAHEEKLPVRAKVIGESCSIYLSGSLPRGCIWIPGSYVRVLRSTTKLYIAVNVSTSITFLSAGSRGPVLVL